MQKWKEEFVGYNQRKCVHIHVNGDYEHGKVLYLETDWSFLDFLNAASNRLQMMPAAKKSFNSDGMEINDCMMIEDNEMMFLSSGEPFKPPFEYAPDDDDSGSRKVEDKIPHSIGGYKTGDLLGRGGFGEVRIGEHHITGDRVALKFLRKSEIHSLGAAERTNLEIQCLSALKHTNIIRLHQHTESQNHVVLIFELMEGGDLLQYLVRRQKAMNTLKACLTEDEARHVFYQVISAISYAHNQHICHRDLKLENILLKDNTLAIVKIADFGLSDFYRPGAMVKSNCGTLSFLAPEVFKGTANAGPPLDVWAMGVILFALLCGRLPFEGPDLIGTKRPRDAVIKTRIMKCQYKLDDNLGAEAKDLLRRMLQSDPAERITIPELFNHSWIRAVSSSQFVDLYQQFLIAQNPALAASTATDGGKANAAGDNFFTLSPSARLRKAANANNTMTASDPSAVPALLSSEEPVMFDRIRSRMSSSNMLDASSSPTTSGKHHSTHLSSPKDQFGSNNSLVSMSQPLSARNRRPSRSRDLFSSVGSPEGDIFSAEGSPRIVGGGNGGDLLFTPPKGGQSSTLTSSSASTTPVNIPRASTIKLIPLRRNNSNGLSSANSSSNDLPGMNSGGSESSTTPTNGNGVGNQHRHSVGNSTSTSLAGGIAATSARDDENISVGSTSTNASYGRARPSSSVATNGGGVGGRGKHIITSITKEEDQLILSPAAAAESSNINVAKKYYGSKKDVMRTGNVSTNGNNGLITNKASDSRRPSAADQHYANNHNSGTSHTSNGTGAGNKEGNQQAAGKIHPFSGGVNGSSGFIPSKAKEGSNSGGAGDVGASSSATLPGLLSSQQHSLSSQATTALLSSSPSDANDGLMGMATSAESRTMNTAAMGQQPTPTSRSKQFNAIAVSTGSGVGNNAGRVRFL